MLKQIIEHFLYIALMHKAVMCAKYQKRILTNAQNNNGYIQFVIDDNPFWDSLISVPNVPFTLTLNIDILAFVKTDNSYSVLDAQNDCFTVGIEWLHYLMNDETFMGKISVRDYQFLAISNYTDDNCAGQRLTVQFVTVDPIDLCGFMDNFSEDFVPVPVEDKEIDIIDTRDPSEINNLELRPILLPTKKS